MILQFTSYCEMECPFCCMNSSRQGFHMPEHVFNDTLKVIESWNPYILLISGGEPTDHPLFELYMEKIKKLNVKELIVLSNGLFIKDNTRKIYLEKYEFQITNDKRYYPTEVEKIEHRNIVSFDIVRHAIYPCTRVFKNNINYRKIPTCFNFRSMFRSMKFNTMKEVVKNYEIALQKVCLPIIKPDGKIIIGECDMCKIIGSIYDSDQTLIKQIVDLRCNNCTGFDGLNSYLRTHLGE
jgi:organic radical activating enzyme